MLSALATFLNTLTAPLTAMGQTMQLNAATYASLLSGPAASKTMATHAFNVFAGEWIDALGAIAIGGATFLSSLVSFLQGVVALL